MAELSIGQKAPDFTLPRDGGGFLRLADYRGRPVVLFFYPKDDTSACTAEAIDFTAHASAFEDAGVAIIGMSPDSVKRHDRFVKKYGLSTVLASDEDKSVLQAYGAWAQKSLYGRKYMGVERTTLLIDAQGIINRIWEKVRVPGHVEEVLAAARALADERAGE